MATEIKTTFLDAVKTMIESTFTTNNHPNEEEVRERAYLLWEEAGRPEGDGVDFWVQAEQQLLESP
jgi:hypothetical protein